MLGVSFHLHRQDHQDHRGGGDHCQDHQDHKGKGITTRTRGGIIVGHTTRTLGGQGGGERGFNNRIIGKGLNMKQPI